MVTKSAPKIELPAKPQNTNFQDILVQQKDKAPGNAQIKDPFKEIQEIQKSILNGKELSGKDLILYQIKTGHFSMRVELVSKVAEAAVSTVKKFQNPQ